MKGFFYTCLGAICLAILIGALSGYIFMLLWNWLAPLFWNAAPHLTFWQAWGVCIILSWIGNLIRGTKSSN